MRIALICTEKLPVPPIAGGAVQLYIDGILPYLSKKHELTVYSIQYPGLPERETTNNVRYIRVPGGSNTIYLNSLKKALDGTYDLIHVFNRPKYVVELMRLLPQTKFSLSLHNEMFHPEKISDEDGRQLIQRVEFINTVSRYIANTVKTRFPSAESKLRVVYSGVDIALFKPVWSAEGRLLKKELKHSLGLDDYRIALFVGRLSNKKGVHVLMKAMEKVMASVPKTALVVIGSKWYGKNESDEYTDSLKAKSAALRGPLVFTGFLPPSEVSKYYCIGDVFVCPSQWNEPLARVHYEAMAAGLPIITTDRGGNAEVVSGKGNGFVLTDYSNPDLMADRIIYLLKNPGEALKMGNQGRLAAEREFSWERVAEEVFPDSVLYPDKTSLPLIAATPVKASVPEPVKLPTPDKESVSDKPFELAIPPAPAKAPTPVKPPASDKQLTPMKSAAPSPPDTPENRVLPEKQGESQKTQDTTKPKPSKIHYGWNREVKWFGG